MVTIRCTRKLLRRLDVAADDTMPESTTILGDWYANILYSRPNQLVLCVSARSLLPVVLPAREIGTLAPRFCDALGSVLMALRIPKGVVEAEMREMEHSVYGPTQNRRLLGSVNDFMYHLSVLVDQKPDLSPTEMALHLAAIPCAPIGYKFPREAAFELLCGSQ